MIMKESMKFILDNLYVEMNSLEKIYPDPVCLVHKFKKDEDLEIVALISALFAFGKVENILKTLDLIFTKMDHSPYIYLKKASHYRIISDFKGFCYRFVDELGMIEFLSSLSELVKKYEKLGNLVVKDDLLETLSQIRKVILGFSSDRSVLLKTNLLADVYKGSPAKRWMLFSRWMVRKDNVDIGLWNHLIKPASLVIPLDTHILRIGGYLNFTNRKDSSMKTAIEITESLKKMDELDPVKYDFSICHLGIRNVCTVKDKSKKCDICPLADYCSENK